ncbi:asparagine synthase (glutamine-hydrolyzing) [Desulfonatronum thioautotrophicum]|uniref:asparagine synthase (glutamine-hydrolyzing) n=1 Tax=Desulfonatronum thioautotrophicum TaxID=617001 RepID=UPI0005EBDB56|nr:asparagine synthase (glutamine-hydrolyzing) [Desulfonatronum thioautotrophicum]
MCGIAGFISFHGHDPQAARERVGGMTDVLAHRGPDASGVYADGYAALGHRRLSIIDLSSGQQPMATPDGRLVLVFNGEIYNYLELRRELADLGHVFQTSSDTEVILQAYARWGRDCVARLAGMFAFALWDVEHRRLLLARDRVGKKPLYYTWDGRTLAFGSELKALLAGGWSRKQLDPQALDAYFCLGYIPSPRSVFTDVRKLEPAREVLVTAAGLDQRTYWSVSFARPVALTLDQAAEQFEELLGRAVGQRLMSEVPLGAFLSGGLDSNLVVAAMVRAMDQPVRTTTIGFGAGEFDETAIARETARHLATDHQEYTVRPRAAEDLTALAWHFDEPFADSSALPTWHVCRMARQRVTVALSGDGGDESFGGYTFRYRPHLLESLVRKALPAWLRAGVFGPLGRVYPASRKLPRPLRLKTFLQNLAVSDARAFAQDLVWLTAQDRALAYAPDFLQRLGAATPQDLVMDRYAAGDAPDALGRAQQTDLGFYMTEDVLVKVDRMSMAHALEVRSPLLDHRIIEFAATLPPRLKLQGSQGKVLLRHVARHNLPRSVVDQPKKGFSIPAAAWLRTDLKQTAHTAIFSSQIIQEHLNPTQVTRLWQEHQSGHRDHDVFLWGLMMLGLWEECWG